MIKNEHEKNKQLEPILFAGLVNVSGAPDVGKTTFALENGAPPEKICFIDDDLKGAAVAREFEEMGRPFGKYVNLVRETEGMLENEFHKYTVNLIKNLEEGKYSTIIFDSFSRFENSFQPYVLTHQKDFRKNWSPMGSIHGAEVWLASFDYEAEFLDMLQQKAPLIIITSHLKNENIGGRRTGKMIPNTKRPLVQKCLLRIILRRSDDGSPIPTGLILKRISKKEITENGIETINILPVKVPHLTWAKIREYYENPVGNRAPTKEEMPNEHELALLDSSVLTDDQKLVMRFAIEASKEQDKEEQEGLERMKSQMLEMKESGSSLPEIAEAFDTDVPTVASILKG